METVSVEVHNPVNQQVSRKVQEVEYSVLISVLEVQLELQKDRWGIVHFGILIAVCSVTGVVLMEVSGYSLQPQNEVVARNDSGSPTCHDTYYISVLKQGQHCLQLNEFLHMLEKVINPEVGSDQSIS